MSLLLKILPARLAICRLPTDALLPDWLAGGPLWAAAHTAEELSLVCEAASVPAGVRSEGPWSALKVDGPLDFALTGILASLAGPLASAGVSLFALSTFDTDYILVREERLADAVAALEAAGHSVRA